MGITVRSGISYVDSGLPTGGTPGQVLTKFSTTDYDVYWAAGGGIGGSIAATQIAFGSGANTITGSADLIYDGTTLTNSSALVSNGGAVFNELGANVDFRIESVGNANLFHIDANGQAGTGSVGIGGPAYAPGGPLLWLYGEAWQMAFGNIRWLIGESSSAYGGFQWLDTPNTLAIGNAVAAGMDQIQIDSSGNVIINEAGRAANFRVEGDTKANLFLITGSTDTLTIDTPNWTFDGALQTLFANGIGATPDNTKGLLLSNTTAATSGAQKYSPAIHWHGAGFATGANVSKDVDARMYVLPIQQGTNPSWQMVMDGSVGGAAYTVRMQLTDTAFIVKNSVGSQFCNLGASGSTISGLQVTAGSITAGSNLTITTSNSIYLQPGGGSVAEFFDTVYIADAAGNFLQMDGSNTISLGDFNGNQIALDGTSINITSIYASSLTFQSDGSFILTDNAGSTVSGDGTGLVGMISAAGGQVFINGNVGIESISSGNIDIGSGSTAVNLLSSVVTVAGIISNYRAVNTAGYGIEPIRASGRFTAQTAAKASVATFTPAADGSFDICANILITVSTVYNFSMTCTYTDEGNTARTLTLEFSNLAGTLLTSITGVGTVPLSGIPVRIRAKASTAITLQTTGTFTTVTYNVEGTIKQVA